MSKPTHQDALVLLAYKQWRHAIGYSDAMDFVWSDRCPANYEEYKDQVVGTPEEKLTRIYADVHETIGALYKHGLIHLDLLMDLETYVSDWERTKDIILGYREANEIPTFMECFELLVEAERAYRAG